jgi:hypothetical protein
MESSLSLFGCVLKDIISFFPYRRPVFKERFPTTRNDKCRQPRADSYIIKSFLAGKAPSLKDGVLYFL